MAAVVKKKTSDPDSEERVGPRIIKNATDLQRIKLEKLMSRPVSLANPDKPAFIPEKRKDKQFPEPPEFIRNVMGSSAGAGSGEFHIYRHIRRRETARQQFLDTMSEKDRLNEEYKIKLEENERMIEEKIAKKRAKRMKKKNAKKKKGAGGDAGKNQAGKDSSSEEEEGKKSATTVPKPTLSFRTSDHENSEESADES